MWPGLKCWVRREGCCEPCVTSSATGDHLLEWGRLKLGRVGVDWWQGHLLEAVKVLDAEMTDLGLP